VAQIQDEGFHEIQLNGKQLVFLFMAATVVSVVIFLCGVLVGRGVRAERAGVADPTTIASVAETTPQPPTPPPAQPPIGSDPTAAAAPPPVDDLSYFKRLEKSNAPAEQLKATPPERAATVAPAEKAPAGPAPRAATLPPAQPAPKSQPEPAPKQSPPEPAPKQSPSEAAPKQVAPEAAPKQVASEPAPKQAQPESARPASSDAASEEPAGQGFAVQIAALNVRSEAESIAKRLNSKGYAAYVISPATGTPAVYRVRVGKFNTRREAETVAAKLQKEEQFKPWVTR
jgi:cell division septation protein DedD